MNSCIYIYKHTAGTTFLFYKNEVIFYRLFSILLFSCSNNSWSEDTLPLMPTSHGWNSNFQRCLRCKASSLLLQLTFPQTLISLSIFIFHELPMNSFCPFSHCLSPCQSVRVLFTVAFYSSSTLQMFFQIHFLFIVSFSTQSRFLFQSSIVFFSSFFKITSECSVLFKISSPPECTCSYLLDFLIGTF